MELYNKDRYYFEQIQETTSHKIENVHPLTTDLTDHRNKKKQDMLGTVWKSRDKLIRDVFNGLLLMDVLTLGDQEGFTYLSSVQTSR